MSLTPQEFAKLTARLSQQKNASADTTQPDISTTAPAASTAAPADGPVMSALKGNTSFPADTKTSNPLPNLARMVGNIPSSAAKIARAVVAPVNPLDTENPTNIGANIVKTGSALTDIYRAKGPLEGTKAILGGFANSYLKMGETIYGSIEKAYNALLDDPKKAIGDVTTHLAKIGIEDPLLVPSLIAGGEGAGATAGEADVGAMLSKGANATVDTAAAVVKPVLSKTGQALKAAGESSTGLGVSMSEPTKILMQNYEAAQPSLLGRVKNFITGAATDGVKPITEANTAVRNGLNGTEWQLGVQAKKISNNLWEGTIQPALEASKKSISKSEFFNNLEKKIVSENADLTRRSTLLNALDSFKEDYKYVSNFSLAKLQEYKEGWAKFVPDKAYKGQPIAGALTDVRNLAAQQARSTIYDELGGAVKTAYLDYGNLKNIAEAGIKSIDPLRSKGVSRQVWEALLDKAVTPVATTLGKVLYRAGNGIELLGGKGAKTVRDIVTK